MKDGEFVMVKLVWRALVEERNAETDGPIMGLRKLPRQKNLWATSGSGRCPRV
jgi:hypothetical protein